MRVRLRSEACPPTSPTCWSRRLTSGTTPSVPAHTRIEQWLTGVIAKGAVVPGDKLPREEALAAALGVSRMTLRQALAALERHGTIVRKPGPPGRDLRRRAEDRLRPHRAGRLHRADAPRPCPRRCPRGQRHHPPGRPV